MEIMGKPTINPVLFYTGKIAGYINWTLLLLSILKLNILHRYLFFHQDYIAYGLFLIGLIISFAGLFYLGRSARFGLLVEKTTFKTRGIYSISRNPIYLGFDLVTLSSMIYFLNPLILLLGVYCLIIYHYIIIGEEQFLEKTFGSEYLEYKKKVRRYI